MCAVAAEQMLDEAAPPVPDVTSSSILEHFQLFVPRVAASPNFSPSHNTVSCSIGGRATRTQSI